MRVLIFSLLVGIVINLQAQTNVAIIGDTIFDAYGTKYTPEQVSLNRMIDTGGGNMTSAFVASASCVAGYFEIHFEVGCGMEGNTTTEINRRNVVCQVFTDLSNYINSPLTSNLNPSTNKVRIVIRNISTVIPAPPASAAAIASALYEIPQNIVPGPGVSSMFIDNAVAKTIQSGIDCLYNNTIPNINNTSLYHGYIAFNFSPTYTNVVPQHYGLTSLPTVTGAMDFYSLVLHEASHVLGFLSTMKINGTSVFNGLSYFGRYDSFLRSGINNLPLINQSTSCGPAFVSYNSQTPASSNLSPGSPACTTPNAINCVTAVRYAGNTHTVCVYRPSCFTQGNSLSHFDHTCSPPPVGNGLYCVNGTGMNGIVCRYLKPAEASVLCDLGYNLNSTFGNTNMFNYYNYGTTCNNSVAGVNDGVLNGVLLNIITDVNVPTSQIFPLSNDVSAVSYTCLSVVIGAGNLSNTFGTSFNYTPTIPGMHMLQYFPVNANGKKGNVTNIFIFVRDNCPLGCNISNNGGFENSTSCGGWYSNLLGIPFTNFNMYSISCWFPNYGTTDLFARNCPLFGLPIPPLQFESPTGPNTGNDKILNMSPGEGIQNQLSTGITTSNVYQIKCKIFMRGAQNTQGEVLILGTTLPSAQAGTLSTNNLPGYYHSLATYTVFTPYTWQQFVTTFTYTGTNPINYVNVYNPNVCSTGSVGNGVYVDDFEIIQLGSAQGAANFTLPAQMCQGSVIPNLGANLTPSTALNQSAAFYGLGIQNNNGIWSLTASGQGPQTYTFVYTNTLTNCTYSTIAQTTILANPVVSFSSAINNYTCLTQFQTSSTLTALAGTGNIVYTWLPNFVSQTLTVNPTTTTIYTVSAFNGTCSSTNTVQISVIPPISFLNLPQNVCTGATITNLNTYLAPGSPVGGLWWGNGPFITQTLTSGPAIYVLPNTTQGTYLFSYGYTATPGCSASNNFTMNVITTPTVMTNGPIAHCLNIPNYASTLVATQSPTNLSLNYTWSPGGMTTQFATVAPTQNTTYSVVASNGACVSTVSILQVNTSTSCCTSNNYMPVSNINLPPNTFSLSGGWAINQNLTISSDVTFCGDFLLAPNVSITIAPTGTLSSFIEKNVTRAHFHSCYDMWSGIRVQNGGKVKLLQGDLIEDAIVAIESNSCTNSNLSGSNYDIDLLRVVFNRNLDAIAIKNYTQTSSFTPFRIVNCLFTCREFSPAVTPILWPSAVNTQAIPSLINQSFQINVYASSYLINNYLPVNLKAPHNTRFANSGVSVINSGVTQNASSTNPSYQGVIIGDPTGNFLASNGTNIFDNLHYGIYSYNSNVYSINNQFQYSKNYFPIPNINIAYPGSGIYAMNDHTNPLNFNSFLSTLAPVSPTVNNNKFYDCQLAIQGFRQFQMNVQFSEFYSTQNKLNPITINNNGVYGVYMESNIFKNYAINNNKFMNINYGVAAVAINGTINTTGQDSYGQLWGALNIMNNYFGPVTSPTTASIGNNFMNDAIIVQNIINSNVGISLTTPTTGLNIYANTMDRVWRGVRVINLNAGNFPKTTANNYIRLEQDFYGAPQWGINYTQNKRAVVNTNTVIGQTTNTNNVTAGIYASMNTSLSVQCNSLVSLPRGQDFNSLNAATYWRSNRMNNLGRGMQLSNNGVIGIQGGPGNPSDNVWEGGWAGRKGTWTDQQSFAINSKVFKRSSGNFNMPNADGFLISNSYGSPFGYTVNTTSGSIFSCSSNNFVSWSNPSGYREMLEIASDSFPTENEPEEINEFLLFWALNFDSLLIASNDTLQQFYEDNTPEIIGDLALIESYLSLGDYYNAGLLLSSLSPETNIQDNFKTFYSLYRNYKLGNDSLSFNQMSDLNTLASQCPFSDGPAIYKARTLLDLILKQHIVYYDESCGENGFSQRVYLDVDTLHQKESLVLLERNENKKIERRQSHYFLYPNPTLDWFKVGIKSTIRSVNLTMHDITGRLILDLANLNSGQTILLPTSIENGIYFVTLTNNKEKPIVKKLIISK